MEMQELQGINRIKLRDMKKGWYKNSLLKQSINNAKTHATAMGYQGEEHQDQVMRIVLETLIEPVK